MATIARLDVEIGGKYTLDKEFKKAVTGINKFAAAVQRKSSEVETYLKRLEDTTKKFGDMTVSQLASLIQHDKKIASSWADLSKQQRSFVVATLQLNKRVADSTKTTREATKALDDYSKGLKSTSNSLWLMTMGLQQFGRAMSISFTVPIVGAGALAIKTFTDLDKAAIKIQTVAGLTAEGIDNLTESFVKISQEVPIAVEELQKAGYAGAQAGIRGGEGIANFSEAIVKLSKVGGSALKDLPIEDLANRLAMLMSAFKETGENWENTNDVASMMLAVSKAIPGGLSDLIEALRRVGGHAALAGLSLANTTAIMGTLVAVGVPAARSGTQFASVLNDIMTNAEGVGEALGRTRDEMVQMIQTDMIGVINELVERFGLVELKADRGALVVSLFGETGAKAMLPLINNLDLMRDMQARANHEIESGALLSREFDAQATSLSGTMEVFKNNIQALAWTIGKDLAPYVNAMLKRLTQGLRNAVEWWQKLNPSIRAAIVIFSGLLAVIGPLALLLNTLFLNPISGIITFTKFLTQGLASLGTYLVGVQAATAAEMGLTTTTLASASSMSIFSAATRVATVGIQTFAASLWSTLIVLGKILLPILAVVGAVLLLMKMAGFKLKLPKMPRLDMPEVPQVLQIPGVEGGEAAGAIETPGEKATKKRAKALEKELKAKKKALKKELKIINKRIKETEKLYKTELKLLEQRVDQQQDLIDKARETQEEYVRQKQEEIALQQEALETAKDAVKAAKGILSDIKKQRQREIDIAEGMVDYQKMNLRAAQDRLKRLKILGMDEFDAEFRAAEARVKALEETTTLAEWNLLHVKKNYQDQIEAAEAVVDANQDIVEIEELELDKLKDLLAERKRIYEADLDVLRDELKLRQDALGAERDARDEKLDLLREERDTIQEGYDAEIEIIQDRLDAARDVLDAIAEMGIPELPDPSAMTEELNEYIEEIQKAMEGIYSQIDFGGIEAPGSVLEALANIQEAVGNFFTEGIGANIIEKMFYLEEGDWEAAQLEAKRRGKGLITALMIAIRTQVIEKATWVTDGIMTSIFGDEAWRNIKKEASEKVITTGALLVNGLSAGVRNTAEKLKTSIKINIIDPTKKDLTLLGRNAKGWGQILVDNFSAGMSGLGNLLTTLNSIKTEIMNKLSEIGRKAWTWGSNLIRNFINGIKSKAIDLWDVIKKVLPEPIKSLLKIESAPEKGPLKNVDKWMPNMMEMFTKGITKGLPELQQAASGISAALSGVDIGTGLGAAARNAATVTEARGAPQGGGTTVYKTEISPGVMIASQGEIREFARMLKPYLEMEQSRSSSYEEIN